MLISEPITVVREIECSKWAGLGHVWDVRESSPHNLNGVVKDGLDQSCSIFTCFSY